MVIICYIMASKTAVLVVQAYRPTYFEVKKLISSVLRAENIVDNTLGLTKMNQLLVSSRIFPLIRYFWILQVIDAKRIQRCNKTQLRNTYISNYIFIDTEKAQVQRNVKFDKSTTLELSIFHNNGNMYSTNSCLSHYMTVQILQLR